MAAFDITDGVTFAKNPWRNTSFGNGSHYVRTANPQESDSQAQQQQQERFAQASRQAAQACSNESGMANAECRAREVRDQLS